MLCSGQTPKTEIEKRDYEGKFEVGHVPEPFSEKEREEWIGGLDEVVVSSDAFCEYRFLIGERREIADFDI